MTVGIRGSTAKNFLIGYSSLPKSSVMGVFSELNQYRSSIGAVSDPYAHICIRPVWIACLKAVFVELIQSCRTDTDTIYSSLSDLLPKSFVAFLGTDLDQIGSSSDSKRTILLCKAFVMKLYNQQLAISGAHNTYEHTWTHMHTP